MNQNTQVQIKGARVRVQIQDPDDWAQGSADALNGLTGTVVELAVNGCGATFTEEESTLDGPVCLVRLDRKPRKWWSNQLPSREWRFKPTDLRLEKA